MLKLTQAWKTTGGECFEQKSHAFSAEILHLYRSLPKWDGVRGQVVPNQIKRMFSVVDAWLEEAKLVVADIGKDKNAEIDKFKRLVKSMEEWSVNAHSIVDEIDDEKDTETSRFMSGQGG